MSGEEQMEIKRRAKISQAQSDTWSHVDDVVNIWAKRDPASVAILFTWTGRSPLKKAWFQIYGTIPDAIPIPATFVNKLGNVLRRAMRFFHPHFATQPGDEAVVRWIEDSGDDSVHGISDNNAGAFFAFVEQQGYFGRMPVSGTLMDAWMDWLKDQSKENAPPSAAVPSKGVPPARPPVCAAPPPMGAPPPLGAAPPPMGAPPPALPAPPAMGAPPPVGVAPPPMGAPPPVGAAPWAPPPQATAPPPMGAPPPQATALPPMGLPPPSRAKSSSTRRRPHTNNARLGVYKLTF